MGQPAIGHVLQATVGSWGSILINVGLIISTIVSWLSWTMLPAETTMLVADDKAMPKIWGKVNAKKAPTVSLMITAVLQTIFLFSLLFTDKAYEFAYSLCSAAILFSYLFVGLYQMKYSSAHQEWGQFTIGLLSAAFKIKSVGLLKIPPPIIVPTIKVIKRKRFNFFSFTLITSLINILEMWNNYTLFT